MCISFLDGNAVGQNASVGKLLFYDILLKRFSNMVRFFIASLKNTDEQNDIVVFTAGDVPERFLITRYLHDVMECCGFSKHAELPLRRDRLPLQYRRLLP